MMWELLGMVNGQTLLIAIIAGLVTFVVSVVRNKKERDDNEPRV